MGAAEGCPFRVIPYQLIKKIIAPTSVSDPDPYHWAGSGSTKGNINLDMGTKKNRDKLA